MHHLMIFGLGLLGVLAFIILPALPLTIYDWLRWWSNGKTPETLPTRNFEDRWFAGFLGTIGLFFVVTITYLMGLGINRNIMHQ